MTATLSSASRRRVRPQPLLPFAGRPRAEWSSPQLPRPRLPARAVQPAAGRPDAVAMARPRDPASAGCRVATAAARKRKQVGRAVEAVGSCIMLVALLVLAIFG